MYYKFDQETLTYIPKKANRLLKVLLAIGMMVASITMYTMLFPSNPIIKTIYKFRKIDTIKTDIALTEDNIIFALHKHGCVLPSVAVAQAKLESNLGKSEVGKNAKNLFGITHHKCQYVSGKYGVYAKYNTYEDNIKCYIHIQDFYLKNINGHYASDSEYTKKLKLIK